MKEKVAQGRKVPGSIDRICSAKVDLNPMWAVEWEAFFELNLHRQASMGLCAMSLGEIEAWARMHGYIPGDDMEDLIWAVTLLDHEYIRIHREREAEQQKADEQKQGNAHERNKTAAAAKQLIEGNRRQ